MIFMALPDKENIYRNQLPDRYRTLNRVPFLTSLSKTLDRKGIPNIPLYEAYMRAHKSETLYFRDDTHWSPAGVRVAVDESARVIGELELRLTD